MILCSPEHAIVDWTVVVDVSVTLTGFALLAMGSPGGDWSEQAAFWVAIAALIA